MNAGNPRVLARSALALLFCGWLQGASPVTAAVAPSLGTAYPFAALGTNGIATSGTFTCTTSTINGDVGSTFNAITNTGCTIMTAEIIKAACRSFLVLWVMSG